MSIEKNKFYYCQWYTGENANNYGVIYLSDIDEDYVVGAIQYNCANYPRLFNTLRILTGKERFGASHIKHEITFEAVRLHQPLLYQWYLENILQESSNILTTCL